MLSGKDLLIEIIKPALSAVDNHSQNIQEISFDNEKLTNFLNSFIHPEDILNLTDELLKILNKSLEDNEDKEKFIGNIKFIKGLAQLSNEKKAKLTLDKEQLLTLDELRELVEEVIKANTYNIKVVKESNKNEIEEYRRVLSKIQKEEIIDDNDYDVIERLILKETPNEAANNLDKIYSFINEFNARELSKEFTGIKETPKPKIKINLTKVIKEPKPVEIEVISREIESFEEEAFDVFEMNTIDFSEFKESMPEDIFDFVNIKRGKPEDRDNFEENLEEFKEIIKYLEFDNHELDNKYITNINNIQSIKDFAKYLKEENKIVFSKIKKENIYSLLYLLQNSNKKIVESVLKNLNDYFGVKSAGGQLFKIVNLATPIFGSKQSKNFNEIAKILNREKVSLDKIINKNITFLYSDPKALEENIKNLKKYNANIKEVIENCNMSISSTESFTNQENKLKENIKTLEVYGILPKEYFKEDSSSLSLLNSNKLSSKLDQLIEVGLNEEIHKDETKVGNAIRTFIIKKVYYAYKNEMNVWEDLRTEYVRLNTKREDKITYQEFLKEKERLSKENKNITEEEILIIKSDHLIMEMLDESMRSAIYSDMPNSILKRKTELIFDTQIISRPKVFKIFDILTKAGEAPKKALLKALVHDSILEESEFEYIYEYVNKIGE